MKTIFKFLSIPIVFIGIISCGSNKSKYDGEVSDLVVVGTTDLHMAVSNYDYFQDKDTKGNGLPYVSAMVKKIRAESPNVILVDNGDTIQGNPFGDYFARINPVKPGQAHPMYALMGLLGFDAGGLGNHEFNYGYDYIKNAVANSPYKLTNSNVIDTKTNKPAFEPYLILTKDIKTQSGKTAKIKIGIVSTVPPQVTLWDKISLNGSVKIDEPVEAVKKYVSQMKKKGADIIIVLSHAGIDTKQYSPDMENTSYYITKLNDIDAIFTGHSHRKFPQLPTQKAPDYPDSDEFKIDNTNGTINGIPLTMASTLGDVIGVIDLKVENKNGKWNVIEGKSHLQPMLDADGNNIVEPDQLIYDSIKNDDEKVKQYIRQPLGKIDTSVNSYFSLEKNDMSVQIVADAQTWYAQGKLKGTQSEKLPILSAAAPFKAGYRGGYTNFQAGDITIRNTTDLYLYPNTIVIMKLKGSDIKQWLEWSAQIFNTYDPGQTENNLIDDSFPTYNYDIMYGIEYQIDLTQKPRYNKDFELISPSSSRIVNMTYNGAPMDMNTEYIVVTNNYRASTNKLINDSKNIVLETADENRQALIDYIKTKGTLDSQLKQVWSFKPIGATFKFKTSLDAQQFLSDFSDIKYVDKDTDNPLENKGIYTIEI